MPQTFDASQSLTALEQDNTVIAAIEMSKAEWLISAPAPQEDEHSAPWAERSFPFIHLEEPSASMRKRGLFPYPFGIVRHRPA
ncbi:MULTISPECIES: hypothetical protein [unclassified Mesorhizobium]|uniref:hypothetical protein n=1 Tax=unclassified Mesorhizobium TaxID=325217 RepID=UPI0003D01042|nr:MULTISPECIES: hypothetical protein [unclassified Mesorhizobium]ESZ02177.1 hypothetical protein X736_31040 [Mesorhizobium sp. L2C089B000]WJI50340.1 hypothetical protein NLY44_27855 [Mesorhizobium sp. C089B]